MFLGDLVTGIWLGNRTGHWKKPGPSLFQCLPDIGLGTGTDERECRKQDLPRVGPSLGATWSHWERLDRVFTLSLSLALSGPGCTFQENGRGQTKANQEGRAIVTGRRDIASTTEDS